MKSLFYDKRRDRFPFIFALKKLSFSFISALSRGGFLFVPTFNYDMQIDNRIVTKTQLEVSLSLMKRHLNNLVAALEQKNKFFPRNKSPKKTKWKE